jgi:hypothetical protein
MTTDKLDLFWAYVLKFEILLLCCRIYVLSLMKNLIVVNKSYVSRKHLYIVIS